MGSLPTTATIIFDGSCNFCTWSVELVQRFDRHQRLHAVPFQGPGVLAAHGLTQAETEAAVWAMTPDGKRYRGAGAVNLALAVALGTRLPMRLYTLPLIRQAQDVVYAAIARHRHRIRGVTPYCQRHPDACVHE